MRQALRNAAGSPTLELEESALEGSHGNRILVLEGQAKAASERALVAGLARDDPEGLARLHDEVPRRLDEHLNFFLRLDKQAAYEGRLVLATSDDAVTVRGKVRSFPKPGEDARALAVQSLQALLERAARPGVD